MNGIRKKGVNQGESLASEWTSAFSSRVRWLAGAQLAS